MGKTIRWGAQVQAPTACAEIHFLHLYHRRGNSHFAFSRGPISPSAAHTILQAQTRPLLCGHVPSTSLWPTALPRRPGLGRQGGPLFTPLLPFCRCPLLMAAQLVITQNLFLPLHPQEHHTVATRSEGAPRCCQVVLLLEPFQLLYDSQVQADHFTALHQNRDRKFTFVSQTHRGSPALLSSAVYWALDVPE